MTDKTTACPKCQGAMVRGFIPDFAHGAASFVTSWHEGVPEKSFWRGTKASSWDGIPIGAFRCSACGYLEFYAGARFAAE